MKYTYVSCKFKRDRSVTRSDRTKNGDVRNRFKVELLKRSEENVWKDLGT